MAALDDATALAARVRARDVSPLELVRELRARAAAQPDANAIVTWADDAEERAREAERAVRDGAALGPLHGVPFTVKDTIDTAGVRTTRGSLLFAEHVPDVDAPAVARLRAAGGILLGKTNTPELALWWETVNRVFGRTPNPHDATRTSGGSTGGEAAGLALGLTPLGLGSDVAGSIRAPAGHCGIVGLKPTHGLVPTTGHLPDALLPFQHLGPMARTVRDAALALAVLAGPDGIDHHALPVPVDLSTALAPPRRLRIALLLDAFGPLDHEVVATVRAAAAALAERGHAVHEVDGRWLGELDCNELTLRLFGAELVPYLAPLVAGREADLSPQLRARLAPPPTTLAEHVEASRAVEELRRRVLALHRDHDVILCPVVPLPAPAHDFASVEIGGRELAPRTVVRCTVPWNLTGSPALAVPFGRSSRGLPIGVQLVGPRGADALVLALGQEVEAAAD